jgi:hypothetical protein
MPNKEIINPLTTKHISPTIGALSLTRDKQRAEDNQPHTAYLPALIVFIVVTLKPYQAND